MQEQFLQATLRLILCVQGYMDEKSEAVSWFHVLLHLGEYTMALRHNQQSTMIVQAMVENLQQHKDLLKRRIQV